MKTSISYWFFVGFIISAGIALLLTALGDALVVSEHLNILLLTGFNFIFWGMWTTLLLFEDRKVV